MPKGSVTHRAVEVEPRVRRGYFECRYGQLHVHNAIPPGGGFEEETPLLCLHPATASGRIFERFLERAGRDRSIYAPDLPGFGESDPPPARPAIADYASAIGDFLQTMRFRQIDVLGFQTGSLIAAELAIGAAKQVRRVVMVSVPVLSDSEREAFKRTFTPPAEDGHHLVADWRRLTDSYGHGVPLEIRSRAFADRLKGGISAAWALHAAQQYPIRERLALISQTVLVLRPKDELWDATLRARELLPRARFVELPNLGGGLFEAASEAVVDSVKDFLRG